MHVHRCCTGVHELSHGFPLTSGDGNTRHAVYLGACIEAGRHLFK